MPLYTHRARKDIEALPASMQSKVIAVARQLDLEPDLGTKLKGPLRGNFSINIGRAHRMIYSVEDTRILVKTVRGRKDSFR